MDSIRSGQVQKQARVPSRSRSRVVVGKAYRKVRRAYTVPSLAPTPVIDIKHIRRNPGLYAQNAEDRNYKKQSKNPWRIAELSEHRQALQKDVKGLLERNNGVQQSLATSATRSSDAAYDSKRSTDKESLLAEARSLKEKIKVFKDEETTLQTEIEDLALELPNLSSKHTPIGDKPDLVGYINEHPDLETSTSGDLCRSHVDIGSKLDLVDFSASATVSGWGWYYLTNEAMLLEQALVQYALDVAMKRGWKGVSPPSIVYSHIAAACGFQPRDQNGEQQIYSIEQAEKDKAKPVLSLAGTAEIPLAGMKANQTLHDKDLPLKTIGVSRCYRAEAGARGVDTKGLYRVHEFTKVEMFAWTMPDDAPSEAFGSSGGLSHSETVFEEMVSIQKEILQGLGLHCRILEMSTTDLGASATRKQDIEAFFPGRRERDDGWGEVTSASICTDYQSRRLATRLKSNRFGGKLEFPHTVNGTAMAVPRVLAAILENGWVEKDGSVTIPEVLRPWMRGMEAIRRKP
ncbi:Serine--tRNA ligase, mitochondrial [Cryomyces antarcticus]|nr:Serine--tRNA ligase, mitochondrial [Cryomyces antarcticus]